MFFSFVFGGGVLFVCCLVFLGGGVHKKVLLFVFCC